jgi:propionate CoA-transferase
MALSVFTKAELLLHILKWRFTWNRHDSDYLPPGLGSKFLSARDAAALIPDGATVCSSGMAGSQRASIFFWAIKERFLKEARPRDLTWIVVGAQGSRGKVPGTIEELGMPGLMRRFIAGHAETCKAQLKLATQGLLEVHAFPQGVETFILEAQGRGQDSLVTETGVGSFLDPRVGNGTCVNGRGDSMSAVEGDLLRYTLPKVTVALFTVPYADREGNLYFKDGAMFTEALESARAARANGGMVLAAVADLIEPDPGALFLRADEVDAIVVNPHNEQTGSVPQRRHWPMFTQGAQVDSHDAVERLRFACTVLGITPYRGPVEQALARLAASRFMRLGHRGMHVNIGVGMPEEVCRLVVNAGFDRDVTFLTETGVMGGLPAPGIFFGAAINPTRIVSSAQIFHFCEDHLDATILGLLQADQDGNINVSRRGAEPIHYVGPGGLPDLSRYARNVIFVGSWMAHADLRVEDGRLRIVKPGAHKFMPRVDEITFNGERALARGQNVLYVTNVGVFRLTPRGLELDEVLPGVDVRRDILEACPMRVVLPEGREVAVTPASVVTGQGFSLAWER